MTIRLDHTIVPAKDRRAAAAFFAEIFGLSVKSGDGHFAQVQINESLTFDFADEAEAWGGPGFDPRTGRSHHYAFHVSDAEFDAIFARVEGKGIPYGSAVSKNGSTGSLRTAPGLMRISRAASSAPATNAAMLSLVTCQLCGNTLAARIHREGANTTALPSPRV